MTAWRTFLCGSALATTVLGLGLAAPPASADQVALKPIEELGKFFFFDERLSTPRNKQGCVSCHEPAVGWVLPLSDVNATTVGAPGAQPGAVGGRKTPSNAYASFSPVFQADPNVFPTFFKGGNFWDGRAEGCGKLDIGHACQIGINTSKTITPDDLPKDSFHAEFLGPTADQALNPTFRPGVEQNTREQNVCQLVRTGPYANLYKAAYGEPINCSPLPRDNPAYRTAFKRLAVAVAAWQASPDVNSFSSARDKCISREEDADGVFPCDNLSDEANLGHDIFYGRNDTGRNRIVPGLFPGAPEGPLNAGCALCHNGVPEGDPADPAGNGPRQLYTDNGYHCIGMPYNREIPNNTPGGDEGLAGHSGDSGHQGCYKTPTLRNVAKDELGITKAYMHNGYLKSLKQVVHFYNTSRSKPDCATLTDGNGADIGITDATAGEAIEAGCWPAGEFPSQTPPFLVGNLRLTQQEENALVAYLQSLVDEHTPTPPSMRRNPER